MRDEVATIAAGQALPDATLLRIGPNGPETVRLHDRLIGRKVILFAVPGAYTPTCDSAHMPSFVRTADRFREKGIDEIICVSVNDAHVMRYWGQSTGATDAGITLLADPDAAFTTAIGLVFSNPAVGMLNRSRRYAMLVEDGVVTSFHLEKPGVCEVSTGEAMLAEL
jgi:glutaredoxin/glutathione-dependent peroxiredoxin